MKLVFIAGKFRAVAYFVESLVEWFSRWKEVNDTVIGPRP